MSRYQVLLIFILYSADLSSRQIATPPRTPPNLFLPQICDLLAFRHVWHTTQTSDGAIRLLFIISRRISTRLAVVSSAKLPWNVHAGLDIVLFPVGILEDCLVSQVLLAIEAFSYSPWRKLVEWAFCPNQGVAYGRTYDRVVSKAHRLHNA